MILLYCLVVIPLRPVDSAGAQTCRYSCMNQGQTTNDRACQPGYGLIGAKTAQQCSQGQFCYTAIMTLNTQSADPAAKYDVYGCINANEATTNILYSRIVAQAGASSLACLTVKPTDPEWIQFGAPATPSLPVGAVDGYYRMCICNTDSCNDKKRDEVLDLTDTGTPGRLAQTTTTGAKISGGETTIANSTATTGKSTAGSGSNMGMIGGVVGGIVVLLLVGVVGYLVYRKRQAPAEEPEGGSGGSAETGTSA